MTYIEEQPLLSSGNKLSLFKGCASGCIHCPHAMTEVKPRIDAPALLAKILESKRKMCMISIGDDYEPYGSIERELEITKQCLEVIAGSPFGVSLWTKSDLILRDIELLRRISEKSKCVVQMTLSVFDDSLCAILEPETSPASRRYEVLKTLHENGIPAVVRLAPVLPWLTDSVENISGIMNYCGRAGVRGVVCEMMGVEMTPAVRKRLLPWLDDRFPGLGERYRKAFGESRIALSPHAGELMKVFRDACLMYNIHGDAEENLAYLHSMPERQMSFWF